MNNILIHFLPTCNIILPPADFQCSASLFLAETMRWGAAAFFLSFSFFLVLEHYALLPRRPVRVAFSVI